MFTYTLSVPQAISVSVQQQLAAIPVSPVTLTEVDIYANLGVSASAQATFGFDTTGYQAGNLANGFFIQNASLNARLTAGLSGLLNEADLAGYQVTGAVTGSVTASLHGANGSNKVYANQFSTGGLTFSAPNWNFGITSKFVPPAQMLDLAIHQFGPYLKTLVGTDYQIAANIMNGKGVSPTDIAVALGTVYGIPPQTTAGILHKLNDTATQVAGALSRPTKRPPIRSSPTCQVPNTLFRTSPGPSTALTRRPIPRSLRRCMPIRTAVSTRSRTPSITPPSGSTLPAWPRRFTTGSPTTTPRSPGPWPPAGRAIGGVAYDLWHAPIGIDSPAWPRRTTGSPTTTPRSPGPWPPAPAGPSAAWPTTSGTPPSGSTLPAWPRALQRDHPRLLPDRRGPGLRAGRAIGGVAYDLWHAPIGIDSPGLAAALYNGITDDYSQIAGALASGAGRAIGGVAYDLWHAPIGIDSPGLAAALYNGITHDYSQIAGALASGAGRAIGGVAYHLWHAPIGIDSPGLAAASTTGSPTTTPSSPGPWPPAPAGTSTGSPTTSGTRHRHLGWYARRRPRVRVLAESSERLVDCQWIVRPLPAGVAFLSPVGWDLTRHLGGSRRAV